MNQLASNWPPAAAPWLLGDATASVGQGMETTFEHSWPWPTAVTIALLAGSAIWIIAIYLREAAVTTRWRRTALVAIRLCLVSLVIFMMYGWMKHRHRTDLPDVVILLDDSQSMALLDHYDDARLQSALLARLQKADLDEPTRLNVAKSLMLENDARLLGTLRERYNVKFYLVGASARAQPGETEAMKTALLRAAPDEPSSQLGKALRNVLEAQRGRPAAAIIMFTDGVTTEGRTIGEVAQFARRKGVPLFLVGLGNDKPPRDIRVSDLLVDEVVFAGDLVNFDFRVSATGFAGSQVGVQLRRQGEETVLAEQSVTLGPDGESQEVRLSYRPREKGDFEFVVAAGRQEGEANLDNNQQIRAVSVRDETIRVLFVQEYPSFEFRFLKNMLARGLKVGGGESEKSVELTTVLQEADLEYSDIDETALRVFPVNREELFNYDVLIFGDVNPSFLSHSVMQNIVDFVSDRGGGLVLLAGPRHTPLAYRDTPLAGLFPVNLNTVVLPDPDAELDEPIPIQLSRLGITSPQMQLEDSPAASLAIWRELPGIYWMLEAPDLRPAARVLLEDPRRTGTTGENLPVICLQFVGAGKVVFHATDESYRWSRHPAGEQYFARYWMQTLRYLSRSKLLGASRSAEMSSDREQYRQGEPVRLRVRFLDERLAPPQDDGVTVMLEREGSRRRQVKLRRDSSNRGMFEGTISNLADGSYRAWMAVPTLAEQPPSKRFSIVAPPGEKSRLEMDSTDLKHAAEVSQGHFYTIDTVSRMPRDLPRGRQVRIESLPPRPLWNSPWVAALFVTLIVGEWLLRKRAGLL